MMSILFWIRHRSKQREKYRKHMLHYKKQNPFMSISFLCRLFRGKMSYWSDFSILGTRADYYLEVSLRYFIYWSIFLIQKNQLYALIDHLFDIWGLEILCSEHIWNWDSIPWRHYKVLLYRQRIIWNLILWYMESRCCCCPISPI